VLRKENRLDYYKALDIASNQGDYGAITRLVAEEVGRSLDAYLEVVKGNALLYLTYPH